MAPPLVKNLLRYLEAEGSKGSTKLTTAETEDTATDEPLLPWNGPTVVAVIHYAMQFCSDSEHPELSNAIAGLDRVAASYFVTDSDFWHHRFIRQNQVDVDALGKMRQKQQEFSEMFAKSFIPEVHRFFMLPKLHQLRDRDRHLNRNEILAGLIDFLLQILNCEANIDSDEEKRYGLLQKALSFLLTILGDVPFQSTHPQLEQEVNKLFAEFEVLANEAGSFVHSCVLSVRPVKASKFYAGTNVLLEKFEHLNAKIKQHCIKFSEFDMTNIVRSDVVDSFFILDSLIEDLEDIMNRQLKFIRDDAINDQIQTLHHELTQSKTFIQVIQVPLGIDTIKFKEPLTQIRDLAYEAEFLISSHVVGNIDVWYLNLRLPSIIQKIMLSHKRLQQIKEMHDSKDMKGSDDEVSSQTRETTATVNDIHLVDLNDNITEKVLGDLTGSKKSRQIISLFGMPGIGKTTTASKLYNSRATSNHFDRRAWCVVSQQYSVKKLLTQILMSLASEPHKSMISKTDVSDLGVDIHKNLKLRRYLIVLDDVWHSQVWDELQIYLPDDGNGSRVILTSRIKDAAPNGSIFHALPTLSEDQCWGLLEKKVFLEQPCPPQLLSIGKRISAKCSGIPLAVVTAAGILVNLEKEESVWKIVENQLDTFLLDHRSDYRNILELSYEHLPHNIKPCFLCFSAFPEDAEIPVKKLVWWWVAERFIQKEENKSPEEVAEMYLLDLINRSLVMAARKGPDGGIKTCRIHDLLHDICKRKSREENFFKSTDDFSIYEKHERLHVPSKSPTYWRPFGSHCRSLTGCRSEGSSYFRTMALLKIIDQNPIESYNFSPPPRFDLPFNLRYLGIHEMPKTMVANLVNLEIICVYNREKVYIPSVILRMPRLRHLLIKWEAEFEDDCDFSETTNLRTLSFVWISKKNNGEILRCSPYLRKLKCICTGGTIFPDLDCLAELESLKMVFKISLSGEILSKINFPSTIKKLSLKGGGLPWEMMSILGRLPNLCVLKLERGAFLGDKWETIDDEFQELRFLRIDYHDLRQWNSCSEHFPVLECLVLDTCWELQEVPSDLGNISTLQKIEVRQCGKEACLSAIEIEEEQHGYGNEELQVDIIHHRLTKKELVLERGK